MPSYIEEHPECPVCSSDQTDVLKDPLGIEPTTAECWACGSFWVV